MAEPPTPALAARRPISRCRRTDAFCSCSTPAHTISVPSEFDRMASCNRSPPQVVCRQAPTDSLLDSPPARSRRGDLDAHEGQGALPFIKETRMRLTTMCSATVIAFTVGVGQAGAQTRYDVGLLLGATRTSDEGAALAFDRATTYQATFAWRTWEGSK